MKDHSKGDKGKRNSGKSEPQPDGNSADNKQYKCQPNSNEGRPKPNNDKQKLVEAFAVGATVGAVCMLVFTAPQFIPSVLPLLRPAFS